MKALSGDVIQLTATREIARLTVKCNCRLQKCYDAVEALIDDPVEQPKR